MKDGESRRQLRARLRARARLLIPRKERVKAIEAKPCDPEWLIPGRKCRKWVEGKYK